MFGRSTDGSSDNEAVKITNSLKPFIKKWFGEWGKSCVRSKKMTVTTAPNASTGLIGVTDAFSENEVFVKYMPNCAFAKVGDTVWCKWMYDNMQTLYADNMGSLNVNDNRTCYASLSSAGWYRVLSYNINSETGAKFATACSVDINICTTYNNTTNVSRFVRMLGRYNQVQFSDETSLQSASSPVIDKIRYTYDSNHNGHIDIHYALSVSNGVMVQFDVRTANLAYRSMFVSESLQSVADAPTGETIMTSYDFAQIANGGIITTEFSITTDSNGYYNVSAYPRDKYMILNVLPLLKSDYYAMPTGSSGSTGQWVRVHKANGTAAASESMTIRLAMIHI